MTPRTSLDDVVVGNSDDAPYLAYLSRLQQTFLRRIQEGPLFWTSVKKEDLWAAYLSGFRRKDERQFHTCTACRRFIETYGRLVVIRPGGHRQCAFWDATEAPPRYQKAVAKMQELVGDARITGVFISDRLVWGQPKTGIWRHFALETPRSLLYTGRAITAHQREAEKNEEFATVMTAIREIQPAHLATAETWLRSGSIPRAEKLIDQAVWLHTVQKEFRLLRKTEVVWYHVAQAPSGFCHPRSGTLGVLLELIAAGRSLQDAQRAFGGIMNPLHYQRPQAAPTEGAIAAAEKLAEKLGIARSLERRFARLDEIRCVWREPAKDVPPSGAGVFHHLRHASRPVESAVHSQPMTWEKFRQDVLPHALSIDLQVPTYGNFTALVTALHPDAPPILQWDHPEHRNPVSWYVWAGGASAQQFGLTGHEFVPVEAITLKPSMWDGSDYYHHQGKGVIFVLRGARESKSGGLALFPEILKSELRGVRSVIEAHSRSGQIAHRDSAHAAGLLLQDNQTWKVTVKVRTADLSLQYVLDRWD